MDGQQVVLERNQVTFPMVIKNPVKNEGGVVTAVFTTELTTDNLIDTLERSGDENFELHHPVSGKGLVQGLVWFMLCNAAVTKTVPGSPMLSAELIPEVGCIAKGSPIIFVTINVSLTLSTVGTIAGRCEVWAPKRRGSEPVLVFVATGSVHSRKSK